jgi:DNA-binding transcriptional LysR family regulator
MAVDERVLNGMSVLAAVVKNGSFAAAGKALNMSQSGVSRAIARMEARLGVRLLERTTRSVALNEEGRRFYEQIIPLLAGLEEAAASVIKGKAAVRGRLRVNIDPFFSQLIVAPRLKNFLKRFPELSLELITRDRLGNLVAEGYDLAIRFGEPRPSSLIVRKLLETRVLTVVAPTYLKHHKQPESPAELRNEEHVLIDYLDPETGRPFEWVFRRGRNELEIPTLSKLLLTDVATMHAICMAGYGIAQVLELGVEQSIKNGKLIQLFPDWDAELFPLYAFYPSRYLAPRARAFLDFVKSSVLSHALPG